MTRSPLPSLLLVLAAAAACGGGSAAPQTPGPLALGIVAGQNQITTAGSTQLSNPVVGQLVREPSGRVSFRWIQRAVDPLLPPKAYAQDGTVVNGSPVPGAVVCAVSADATHGLIPFTPCTNTDPEGKATFFFTPGTAAGVAKAEIRGTVDNQPAVFDTAKATVLPAAATVIYVKKQPNPAGGYLDYWTPAADSTLDLHHVIFLVRDAYSNVVTGAESDGSVPPPDLADTVSWTPSWDTCVAGQTCVPTPKHTGWIVTPPPGAGRSFNVYLFGTPTSSAHATYFGVQLP